MALERRGVTLIADAPVARPRRGGGDGAGAERELPGRQPRAAARVRAAPAGASTASRGWSTSSATQRAPAGDRGSPRSTGSRRELDRAFRGERRAPAAGARWRRRSRECALPREPFVRLIEANRLDQRVTRYETWEQLRGYCALSADPVGELVLGVLRPRDARRGSRCRTRSAPALQLAEHCQDVAEDLAARARLHARRGPRAASAAPRRTSRRGTPARALRAVLAFEVARARGLLARARR